MMPNTDPASASYGVHGYPASRGPRDGSGVGAMITRTVPRLRFLILHNSAAGRNGTRLAGGVAEELRSKGAVADIFELSEGLSQVGGAACRYDALVISGGDGSIRAMAESLVSAQIPLGIIPNGTGNVLAEELGMPVEVSALADLLMHGPTHPIAGGLVNGTPFLLMFGAGFDGDVIGGLSRSSIQAVGKLAYVAPVLRALFKKPRLFDVSIDGHISQASWILISNAARYGGRFLLTDQTGLVEPTLMAFISRATTRRARLLELIRLAAGRLGSASTIDVTAVEHAKVLSGEVAAQIDGEPLPSGPFALQRRQDVTYIIAPVPPRPDRQMDGT